jgi:NAD(P)-dependent dehydrogenase (short-subunit alcohol dehydrogenase family)
MAGHVLVVGGTGMLRAATLALARGGVVTAVARDRQRLQQLAEEARHRGGTIVTAAVDYGDDARLADVLRARSADDGPLALALCWIHGTAPDAPSTVARHLGHGEGGRPRFVHVLSHAAIDPDVAARWRTTVTDANPDLDYQQVVLGRRRTGDGDGDWRWLTHGEISSGVLQAIDEGTDALVGAP